jgi:glc operon protein GlcG
LRAFFLSDRDACGVRRSDNNGFVAIPALRVMKSRRQPPGPGDPLFTQRLTNPYGAPVSLETARKATTAAIAEGKKNGWTVAVAVVDPGGVLVYFERLDGTLTASSDIAIGKARTAVAFKRSTRLFEDGIAAGRLQNLGLPGALPIEGGLPLIEDGRIVGAIGVSGAHPEQDGVCVKAAIDALVGEKTGNKSKVK